MSSHEIVAAYNATEEAADGLALGRLLADRLGDELIVARVLTGSRAVVTDPGRQRQIRAAVTETRKSVLALVPEAGSVEIVPVIDTSVARGLHELARSEDAQAIVVGSTHHHTLGRLHLGSGPELVANGSPCPVYVAPPGFRERLALEPELIGVAYDGTPAAEQALRYATALARRLGTPLRLVAVRAPWPLRPVGAPRSFDTILIEGAMRVAEWGEGLVQATTVEREGDPTHEFVRETDGGVGLLVLGSRHHGIVGRALLGSVSAAVLRAARGPVVVTPRA
jgi:nucleotide-binding universal stress UspA family protein